MLALLAGLEASFSSGLNALCLLVGVPCLLFAGSAFLPKSSMPASSALLLAVVGGVLVFLALKGRGRR